MNPLRIVLFVAIAGVVIGAVVWLALGESPVDTGDRGRSSVSARSNSDVLEASSTGAVTLASAETRTGREARPSGTVDTDPSKTEKAVNPDREDATLTETERVYYAKEKKILQVQLLELGDLAWIVRSKYWNPDEKVVSEAEKVKLRALIEAERLAVKSKDAAHGKNMSTLFNSGREKGELESARKTVPFEVSNPKSGFDVIAGGPGGSNYLVYFHPSTEPDLQATWDAALHAKCSMHDKVLWFFKDLN